MIKTIVDLGVWSEKICNEIAGSAEVIEIKIIDKKIVCGKFNVLFPRQKSKRITEIITLEGDFLKSEYRYWFVYEKSDSLLYLFLYKFPQNL